MNIQKTKNWQNFLWVLSSFSICFISLVFEKQTPPFSGGIYYILFQFSYIVICLFFKKNLEENNQKNSQLFFILGVLPLLFTTPLFENDHYRYFWEGKVLLSGMNPYLQAPLDQSLEYISFPYKDSIAFPHVPSIYPPLTLLFFGFIGLFGFTIGLKIMMIINAFLVYQLLKFLNKKKVSHFLLAITFPFLQKEFIQGVHPDLLAFLLLLIGVCFIIKNKKYAGLSFIFLTYMTKLIGILFLPLIVIKRKIKKTDFVILVSLLALPIIYIYLSQANSGFLTFGQYWVWNPGYFFISHKIFHLDFHLSRITSLFFYVLFYIFLLFYFYKQDWTEKNIYLFLYLVFASLMFFSPVFNTWYAIWFLIFALLINHPHGVFYGIFSCVGYIYHGHPKLMWWAPIITHSWFIFSIVDILRNKESYAFNYCPNS